MSRTDDLDQIDDPGEYNQRRVSRSIHDARERIYDQRRHALDMKASGRITDQQYQKILREAVESYILEVEQVLRRYHHDDNQTVPGDTDRTPGDYLKNIELGDVTIPPDGEVYTFEGLTSILEFPDPYVAEWETYQAPPPGWTNNPDATVTTHREEIQIPEHVLLNAVREATAFLHETGLGLQLEDQTPHDEVSHSDLRGLLTLRGQDETADQVPGGGDDE